MLLVFEDFIAKQKALEEQLVSFQFIQEEEMATTYHSLIGTIKLQSSSIWNFIGTFFRNIFNVCRDYVDMASDKIILATNQC